MLAIAATVLTRVSLYFSLYSSVKLSERCSRTRTLIRSRVTSALEQASKEIDDATDQALQTHRCVPTNATFQTRPLMSPSVLGRSDWYLFSGSVSVGNKVRSVGDEPE